MKKGFTLQEVLVTLAMVGIIAAITIPGIVGIMPSKDRIQFLKAYNALAKVVDNASEADKNKLSVDTLKDLVNPNDGITFSDASDGNINAEIKTANYQFSGITIDSNGGISLPDDIRRILNHSGTMTSKEFKNIAKNNENIVPISTTSNKSVDNTGNGNGDDSASGGENPEGGVAEGENSGDDVAVDETLQDGVLNGEKHIRDRIRNEIGNGVHCEAMTPECGYDAPAIHQVGQIGGE